jgi:V8-like Glu-specific endopeptidase
MFFKFPIFFVITVIVAFFSQFNVVQALVIYGDDDRWEIEDERLDENVQSLAQTVLTAVPVDALKFETNLETKNNKTVFVPSKVVTLGKKNRLCVDGDGDQNQDPFYQQIVLGNCNGVLIDHDKVLTAGHCARDLYHCQQKHWVFDFYHRIDGQYQFSSDQVFKCEKILAHHYNPKGVDFSIIQLDRSVKRRQKVVKNWQELPLDTPVAMIGSPRGIPLKYTANATIQGFSTDIAHTNLDSFGGNSGAPVYSANDLKLIGIVVRGEVDYLKDPDRDCYRLNKLNQQITDLNQSEEVVPLHSIIPFLPDGLRKKLQCLTF